MSVEDDDVICLSSSSDSDDCCIVEDGESANKSTAAKKLKNKNLLNNLKDDLSRIRSFTPPQKSESIKQKTLQNGHGQGLEANGASTSNGHPPRLPSPQEIDLAGSDQDFEIEYPAEIEDGGTDDCFANAAPKIKSSSSGKNSEEDFHINCITICDQELIDFKKAMMDNKPKIPVRKIQKAQVKVQEAYDKLKAVPNLLDSSHKVFLENIRHAKMKIKINGDYWKIIKEVLAVMDPEKLTKFGEVPKNERDKKKEDEKQRLLRQAEKELKKLRDKIIKLDLEEVDWDDDENEHNSPYIMVEKYKKRLIDAYYKICDITKCSRFTGRPVQKTIKLKKHGKGTSYDDIDLAVEKFVNKGGCLFIPDYVDIYSIVSTVKSQKQLPITDDEVSRIAQQTFEAIVKIIKNRRAKDLLLTLSIHQLNLEELVPASEKDDDECVEINDPADNDAELKKKLEENERLKKSEAEILAKYVEMAAQQGSQANEIPDSENANESPVPSANEAEKKGEDEEDDEEGSDHDPVGGSPETFELTEDEDEEAENVWIDVHNGVDDEAGSTAGESDCVTDSLDGIIISSVSSVGEMEESNNRGEKRKCTDDESENINGTNSVSSVSTVTVDVVVPQPSKKVKSMNEESNDLLISDDQDETVRDSNHNHN